MRVESADLDDYDKGIVVGIITWVKSSSEKDMPLFSINFDFFQVIPPWRVVWRTLLMLHSIFPTVNALEMSLMLLFYVGRNWVVSIYLWRF